MIGAEPVDELALLVEAFAAEAVEAAVAAEVDVAFRVDVGQDLLHEGHVVGIGGADEVVVAKPRRVPRGPEDAAHAVGVLARRDARGGRRLGDLVAVLVGAGEDEGRPAAGAPEAGEHVGDERHVGVAEVRLGVDVEERRREVERLARHGPSGIRRRRAA